MKNTFEIENAAYVDASLDMENDGTVTYIAVCNGVRDRLNHGQYNVEAKRSRVRNALTNVFEAVFFVSAVSLIVLLIFMVIADFDIGAKFRSYVGSKSNSVKAVSEDSAAESGNFISDSYHMVENQNVSYVRAYDREQIANGFSSEAASDAIERILGMSVENVDKKSSEVYKIPQGVRVKYVFADGSANKVGLHDGDIILSVGDYPVNDVSTMYNQIVSAVVDVCDGNDASPDETVIGNVCISIPVCVYRNGTVKMLDGNFDIAYIG